MLSLLIIQIPLLSDCLFLNSELRGARSKKSSKSAFNSATNYLLY